MISLVGCGSDDNDDEVVEDVVVVSKAMVQVVHASPDAPKVNLIFDGGSIADGVDYKQATGLIEIDAGEHTAEVKAILADGSTIDAFDAVTADFSADTIFSVLAVNNTAMIEPLILTRSDSEISSGNLRIQIVHAAPGAPMVDVYATAPGADLADSAPLVTASFKDSLDATEVPEGDYQIRITAAGDSSAVVFDSGTLALAAGTDLLLAAVENTGPGAQPVNLLAIDSMGATEILDTATPAWLRVVHASADAPAVDVVVNDGFGAPLVSNLAFGEFAGYVEVAGADYNTKVVPTGEETPAVIEADLSLVAGTSYQVIAANELAMIEPLVITANNRKIATEAKLRVIHGSPTAQDVDIYLVAPGADITDLSPTLSSVLFLADTDFLSISPESYDVIVTAAGSKDAAIGPLTVSLDALGIYTIIATDGAGGGGPLSVILLDDFVN